MTSDHLKAVRVAARAVRRWHLAALTAITAVGIRAVRPYHWGYQHLARGPYARGIDMAAVRQRPGGGEGAGNDAVLAAPGRRYDHVAFSVARGVDLLRASEGVSF